jgi:hypothetical protein
MHVNIGPDDNRICRLILRIDNELKQVAPNLTFFHDPEQTPDDLLLLAVKNIAGLQQAPHRQLSAPQRHLRPTWLWHRQLLQRPAAGRWCQHPGAPLLKRVAEQAQGSMISSAVCCLTIAVSRPS